MNHPVSTLSVRAEPVQQRSTERITALLDAAADLIDEQGIDGLTTSDVATRSASSVGVVYRYFPNIQSLLRALAARNVERFTAHITAALNDGPVTWESAFDTILDEYIELSRTEPGFRALRFGDIIDHRFMQAPDASNKNMSDTLSDLLVERFGITASPEFGFDLEVLVEIADALLHRAFLWEREGDERFISKLRELARDHMAPYAPAA